MLTKDLCFRLFLSAFATLAVACVPGANGQNQRLLIAGRGDTKAHADHAVKANSITYKEIDDMPDTADPPAMFQTSFSASSFGKASVVGGIVGGGVAALFALSFAISRRRPNKGVMCAATILAVCATAPNAGKLYDSWFTPPKANNKNAELNRPPKFENIKSTGFQFYGIFPQSFFLTRKLSGKMWMTTLVYMQDNNTNAYTIGYAKLPTLEEIYAMQHPESPNIPAGMTMTFDAQRGLDGMMNKGVEAMHGKIIETANLEVDDTPGREVRGELGNASDCGFKERLFIGNNNLYFIVVAGTSQWLNSEESTRLLDSFHLGSAPTVSTPEKSPARAGAESTSLKRRQDKLLPVQKAPLRVTHPLGGTGVAGTWQWFTNGAAVFYPNGQISQGSTNGSWVRYGKTIRIRWSNGWYNTLTLSADGKSMEGYGSMDASSTGSQIVWGRKIGD